MKRTSIILILLVLIGLTGCENPLKNTFEVLSGEGDYYPLTIGNKWIYSEQGQEDYTLTVKENIYYNGRLTYRVEKKQNSTYSSYYLSVVDDGVQSYSLGSGWYYRLKYPFIRNYSWTQNFSGKIYTFTFDDWSDVEVPAGKFKDAAKFFVEEGTPTTTDVNITGEYYYWYARDVGLVKIEQTYSDSGDLELIELKNYRIIQ